MHEVDVVVESTVGGDQVIISVEGVDHKRPANMLWVEQQIKKHEHMPTNTLALVSWSSFTPNAHKVVEAQGGWVTAVTPEQGQDDGMPRRAPRLFVDQVTLALEPTRCACNDRTAPCTTRARIRHLKPACPREPPSSRCSPPPIRPGDHISEQR
jgi:hypothetical protein